MVPVAEHPGAQRLRERWREARTVVPRARAAADRRRVAELLSQIAGMEAALERLLRERRAAAPQVAATRGACLAFPGAIIFGST